jgi:hypothetical protein
MPATAIMALVAVCMIVLVAICLIALGVMAWEVVRWVRPRRGAQAKVREDAPAAAEPALMEVEP